MSEQKRKQKPRAGEIELVPDAWPRFERFIGEIVKAGPQHRIAKPKSRLGKSPVKRSQKKASKWGHQSALKRSLDQPTANCQF
jgi:hypothetical protein